MSGAPNQVPLPVQGIKMCGAPDQFPTPVQGTQMCGPPARGAVMVMTMRGAGG